MKGWFKWARVGLFAAMVIGAVYKVAQPHQQNSAEAAAVASVGQQPEQQSAGQSIGACKQAAGSALLSCNDRHMGQDDGSCARAYQSAMADCGTPIDSDGNYVASAPYPHPVDTIQTENNCASHVDDTFNDCLARAQSDGVNGYDMSQQCSAARQASLQNCREQEDADQASHIEN